MKFEIVKHMDDEKFRRLTGVKRSTFDKMVTIQEQSMKNRRVNSGRKKKLSLENAWLMTWEYMRENRTYIHVSQSYGISESATYKTVRWIEETRIQAS
jgi:hypothetical protein